MTTTEEDQDLSPPAAALAGDHDGTAPLGAGSLPHDRRSFVGWAAGRWTDPGRRRVTVGWAVLGASVIVYFLLAGIPWSLNWVFAYITAGLIVSSLGTGVRWKRLLLDWLPFYLVLVLYDLLRDYASHTLWAPFVKPQAWFDAHLLGGVAPAVQLQHWLFTPGLHFWDYLVWCCYMTHFFAAFVIAGVLWKVNHAKFRRFTALFVGLTFAGYVTYVLYPAMPPWMAYQTGHLGPVTRIVPVVLNHLHLHSGAAVFTGGSKFDNTVAAMPSLHGAYPMLICLFFWKGASLPKRVLLAAYPICMAFTLVYSGEHFVIDIFVGWIYAAGAYYVGTKLLDRWEARKLGRQLGSTTDGGDPSLPATAGDATVSSSRPLPVGG
jgi:hypothetical protein